MFLRRQQKGKGAPTTSARISTRIDQNWTSLVPLKSHVSWLFNGIKLVQFRSILVEIRAEEVGAPFPFCCPLKNKWRNRLYTSVRTTLLLSESWSCHNGADPCMTVFFFPPWRGENCPLLRKQIPFRKWPKGTQFDETA